MRTPPPPLLFQKKIFYSVHSSAGREGSWLERGSKLPTVLTAEAFCSGLSVAGSLRRFHRMVFVGVWWALNGRAYQAGVVP